MGFRKYMYEAKVEYLHEHGFEGHIGDVDYWYRKMFNIYRGKSATLRAAEMAQKEALNGAQ